MKNKCYCSPLLQALATRRRSSRLGRRRGPRAASRRPANAPEDAAGRRAPALLAGSTAYILLDESFANWQSLWLCAVFLALALTLWRLRDAQSSE